MIQLIKTKLIPTHKSENETLLSKQQLSTVTKVMALVTVSLFVNLTVRSYISYIRDKDILAWRFLSLKDMPGFIYKNLSEKGIAFLYPSNIVKKIAICTPWGCHVKVGISPWPVFFANSIFYSIKDLKNELLNMISQKLTFS